MLAASTWHCGTSPQPTNLVKARAQQDICPRRGFGGPGGLSLVGSVLVAAALRKQWSHRQSNGVSQRSIKDGILASLSDDLSEKKKPKKRSGKKPQGKEAYFSVVVYMLNKGGRLPLRDFEDICKKDKLSPEKVLKALSFISKDGDEGGFQMVEITSAEDLAVYCIVCHLQQDETGQMRMSVLGGVLTSLFCRAPHLEYGKLKALVKAHPDKLDYSQTTQSVSLRTGSRSSTFLAFDDEVQSEKKPKKKSGKKPQGEEAYYSVVKDLIIKGGRSRLSDFKGLCKNYQLSCDEVLNALEFLSKEIVDGIQMVEIASAEDLAVYCIVCHLQQDETGRMQIGSVGTFLNNLLSPAPHLRLGKLKRLVLKHPDKLCFSLTTSYVTLRGEWPDRSLPMSDNDEDVQSSEENLDLEDSFANQTSEQQGPLTLTLLRDAASRYLKRRIDLKSYKGGLGKKSCESDKETLARRFSQCVREHGILKLEVVLGEIDHACKLRKISEEKLFQDPFVGSILAGYARTLLFVEAVIRTSLASQPILTMHELEMSILCHRLFAGQRRFEDACIGKLQNHPLVKKAFGLELLKDMPEDFPTISSEEVVCKLFSPPIVLQMCSTGSRFSNGRSRSFKDSLMKLASEFGFSHWNQLGIAVQEGSFLAQLIPSLHIGAFKLRTALWRGGSQHFPRVLAEWVALTNPQQHEDFLVELAKLATPENQNEFVLRLSEQREDWLASCPPSSYVKMIFGELLKISPHVQDVGDGSLDAEERELGASEAGAGIREDGQTENEELDKFDEATFDQLPMQNLDAQILRELCGKLRAKSANLRRVLEVIGRTEESTAWKESGPSGSFGAWVVRNSGSLADAAGLTTSALQIEESAVAFSRSVALDVPEDASLDSDAWKRLTLESTREQFGRCLNFEELERITDDALAYADRMRGGEAKSLDASDGAGDTLQLHRIAAAAGYFHPPLQKTATGEDRIDLIDRAVDAVLQAPVLLDLAEALPEWDVAYGGLGMDLPEFLRSRECSSALRQKLRDGCLMELNHGTFVRLPAQDECQTGDMISAMKAADGRAIAAIVVARLMREQTNPPVDLMTSTITAGYPGSISNPEDFVLQAVGALPRQGVKVAKLALEIIASGYLRLERPPMALVDAAFSPENSGCLHFQIALKRLGYHFEIDDWKECSWQSAAKTRASVATATGSARVTKLDEVIPEETLQEEQVEEKEAEEAKTAVVPAASGDLKTNKELCWRIAAMKKVDYDDVDLAKRVWVKEPEDEGIRALQSTVQGAVKRLSEDLYSGEAHFLLELLQNVDDCQYPEGEKPTLRLTYESRKDHFADFSSFAPPSAVDGLLVVEHNEAGFQEKNVVAICDIDKSTKKAREKRFIGAKGIGFKSVFLVTATPVIHSGRYHFHFDADALNGLGSLLPFPLTPVSRQTGTRLVLPLSSSAGPLKKRGLRANDVATRALKDMRPTLLLFLQKLECVQAIDSSSGKTRTMTKEVLESDVGGSCQEIKLKSEESSNVQEVTEERWLVYTEPVQLESEAVTELKLAFRLDKPAGVEQAYAWLPLRSYGLRFLIQADWRVPSSREAITEAVFNQRIRDQVPNAYAEAAKIFAAAALKAAGLDAPNESGTAWNQLEAGIEAARNVLVPLYTSIPRPGDATDFFQETDVKILRAVMDVAVILVRVPCPGVKESGSEGGSEDVHDQETAWRLELVTPRRAVRAELPEGVPASLSHLQQSIELLLAQADRYVEVGGMPARAAEGLRVPVLDADIALDCLQAMGRLHMQKVANDQLNALTDEDIEVLQLLLLIVAVAALKKPQLADDVRYLQIIPTEGGELVSLTAEEARGFKVYDVPPDMLGIEALLGAGQRLDPRLTQTARPEVREFLLGLGVEQVDGLAFFTNVLLPVLTSSEAPEAEKLLLATRQFKDLLAICEDQEKKDSLIETLRASDAGWWVLASVGTSDCEAVQVGGKTGRGLHVSPLPGKLADQVGVDWLAPASTYKNSEESEESEADWNAFWMLLGAAPVFQVQERQGDFHSDELERLLAAASTPDLAMEVVEVLEPHGEYYAQWLFKPDSQDEPSEIAQLLCTKPWLPTQGGEVVPMNLAWLPPEKPKSVEARFHFDACVSPFAQAWPALGVESSPSAATLIAIVECLRSKDKLRLKIPEMASLYSRMGSPGRQDPSGNQGGGSGGTLFNKIFGQKNLDRFIEEEQWVFIPNHPRPHRDFTGWFHSCPKMEHTGKFYGLKQLVFCDKAECLDGFAARAKDAMIDLMRQCLDKRVVANYYFGPKTLWPASWRDKGIKSNLHELLSRYNKSNLHELLSRYNIQEELDVSDYVRVYKAIDQRIEKGETSEVLDFIGQTFTRIALRVKNEIEEELHRQEGTEDQDESEEELTVEKSESLEMIRKELSDVRFIQAADESWQPLKKYQFIVSRKGAEKARIKGWPSDARRFFARPPRGVNPAANHSIVELMKRLGMRESPTLLKRASFVPLQGAGNFDSVRKELVEATRVIRDGMSERLKDEDRALFEEIETVVRELQIEEVQQLSVDQVLVIEKDRAAEAEIDTLDADEGVPRWLLEFKPTSGRATPIARIKALPAEVFFIGQEDRKLVLTFQGQLVMKDVSENLSKAVIWTSLQKLAPEYQTEFQQSKTGLTDKARTFMKHLRVAIETTRASRGSAASEFLELSHEESAGESQEDQSPALKADQSEDDPGLDMENMEKFLMLQEEFKDMKDEDYYASWGGGLEETADLDEVDSPAVEDLLEHAENALNYKRKRRTSKKELDQEKPGSSPKVPPSAPPDASGAGTSDASDVLSPNLPYDVAAEPLSGDGASRRGAGGGGSSNTEGSSDAKQAVGKRDEDTWTESGTRDFRDARAPRKNLQQEEEVEDSETVSRIVQAQRQQIASPRPYSFTRLARFCAAPVTTGQSSSFDITFTMRDFTPISTGGGESNAQVVGRNGEKIAQLSLESEGYQVLWLNEKEELGLPFDLLIRKTGDFSSLLVNGAVDKSQVEELASKVEEGQVEEFTFVEVKSTTKGDKGVERSIFDVSINEVVSMNNLGEHFWLLRTLRVPTGLEDGTETKVRIWPNAAKAVRDGEVKLLMVG